MGMCIDNGESSESNVICWRKKTIEDELLGIKSQEKNHRGREESKLVDGPRTE